MKPITAECNRKRRSENIQRRHRRRAPEWGELARAESAKRIKSKEKKKTRRASVDGVDVTRRCLDAVGVSVCGCAFSFVYTQLSLAVKRANIRLQFTQNCVQISHLFVCRTQQTFVHSLIYYYKEHHTFLLSFGIANVFDLSLCSTEITNDAMRRKCCRVRFLVDVFHCAVML